MCPQPGWQWLPASLMASGGELGRSTRQPEPDMGWLYQAQATLSPVTPTRAHTLPRHSPFQSAVHTAETQSSTSHRLPSAQKSHPPLREQEHQCLRLPQKVGLPSIHPTQTRPIPCPPHPPQVHPHKGTGSRALAPLLAWGTVEVVHSLPAALGLHL